MADLVRVSIPSADGTMRPLALLEEDHALQYVMDVSSDHFSERVEENIDKLQKLVQENPKSLSLVDKLHDMESFKHDLDNAIFSSGFRISNF